MRRLTYSQVTPKTDFLNRRQIIAGAAGVGFSSMMVGQAQAKSLERFDNVHMCQSASGNQHFLKDSRGLTHIDGTISWPNAHGQIFIVMIIVYNQTTHPGISHATGLKPGECSP